MLQEQYVTCWLVPCGAPSTEARRYTLYRQGCMAKSFFCIINNKQVSISDPTIQRRKLQLFHTSFTKHVWPKIVSRDPQLLVIECCIFLTWKNSNHYKMLTFWFLQMCLCCNYGTMDWWQITKIFKPSHDIPHIIPFKPLELIIQHYIHGTCEFMQPKCIIDFSIAKNSK